MADLIVVHDSANDNEILLNRNAIATATEGGTQSRPSTTIRLTDGNSITIRERIADLRSMRP
jgi:uncharacterized protein YlzI (FlbEa/FlbD family)